MLETLETLAICLVITLSWLGMSVVLGLIIGKAIGLNSNGGDA